MADSTQNANSTSSSETRTGFCQECGRSLSIATLRRVGNGIFCVPCALRKAQPGWQAVPPADPSARESYAEGSSNPARAAILGLIPGVGAMYNGQYAKGALHLVVFVILLSLADNLNWVFYWFVWGWVFYQAFEAYHTARARRDGHPLPNPFGWNDIGEKLGFSRSPFSSPADTVLPPAISSHDPSLLRTEQDGPVPFTSPNPAVPDWAAYPVQATPPKTSAPAASPLPVRHFGENPYADEWPLPPGMSSGPTAPAPGKQPPPMASHPAPGMHAEFRTTFTGHPAPAQPFPVSPISGARRFPAGAVWLIGLGTLFLLGNLLPGWRLSGHWLVPLLLAAVSLWSGLRRWEQLYSAGGSKPSLSRFAAGAVGPALFLGVAVLLALDASHLLAMRRSWPVILVLWGGLLGVQRSAATNTQSSVAESPAPSSAPLGGSSRTGTFGL